MKTISNYIPITAYDIGGNESDFSTELNYFAGDGVSYGADNCPDTYNPDQEDTYPPQGNGTGDTGECDSDCSGGVDPSDVTAFLIDFGRSQFSNPCPSCIAGDWCVY
jgi:hypothetical protein